MKYWRKVENEKGYIYYVNEQTNVKQWDHPKFSELRQRIDDCNYVKYSTYRVALKFRVLQNALHMEEVPLTIIAGVFERHRLGNNESSLTLDTCDLEAVLSDIYFAANKKNHSNTDIDYASELMLNFLYNVYDREREGKIQVASTKIILGILGNSSLLEFYKFMFTLCSDHNNCVTRLRLQFLLMKIAEATMFLHEDVCFGTHLINSSIEDCFSNSPGLVGITGNNFISWLESGPQILSWIPLLHRIKLAEPIIHTVKCNTCKTTPLMGLRYRCLKCTRYTQCQRCFFTGRTSHSHKLSHSMREYCGDPANSGEFSYTFLNKIWSIFCSRKMNTLKASVVETKPLRSNGDKVKFNKETEVLCDIEPLSSPETQLQVIIRQLEMQNRELQQILLLGSYNSKEISRYLEDHRIHLSGQIQKLKILKDYINLPEKHVKTENLRQGSKATTESTPVVQNGGGLAYRGVGLDLFSPIAPITEVPEKHFESKMSHESFPETSKSILQDHSVPYGIDDISTWIGGNPVISTNEIIQSNSFSRKSPVREFHNDLDDALAKLQQILANNFSLDESLGPLDNTNLKYAVSEVEGMLTSIIDTVETSRSSSVQRHHLKYDES